MKSLLNRSKLTVVALGLFASLFFGMFAATPSLAVKTPIGQAPTSANVDSLKADETMEHEVCGIEGFFGGLTCSFTKFIAELTDASFAMLSIFLNVPPFQTTTGAGSQSGTYTAWALFRGIANALFILGFLVIIYAHITGVGVSNYSVKRMLPRLIIASLLVNLSFYVSALAVDLSNILGGTLKDLLEAAGNQAIRDGGLVNRSNEGGGLSTWSSIASSTLLIAGTGAAVGGAVLYGTFSVFLPLLASAAIAVVTTVLILMIRQMLIIVFIILSPLAFAAMILPNTNKYFDKWRSLFLPLLLVYPAVSLLYGAGYIASIAIRSAGAGNDAILLSVAALGAQIVPLFLTPAVMKLGSGLIDRWGGISNMPGSKIRKKTEDYAKKLDTRADLRSLSRRGILRNNPRSAIRRRRMGKQARNERIEGIRNIAGEADLRSTINDDSPTLAAQMGIGSTTQGEALQRQMAASSHLEDMSRAKNHVLHGKLKAHAEDVRAKAAELAYEGRNEALAKALGQDNTISELEREAAIMKLASVGDIGAIMQMLEGSYTMTEEQRQTLMTQVESSGAAQKMPFLADEGVRDNIMQGNVNGSNFEATVVAAGMANHEVTASYLATGVDKDALEPMTTVIEKAADGDDDLLNALGGLEKLEEYQDAAYQAASTEHTAKQIDKNYEPIKKIVQTRVNMDHEKALLENWFRSRNGSGGNS